MTRNERKFMEHGKKYIMIMERNVLSNNWACWIPGKPLQMYFVDNKRSAAKFVKNVNAGITSGKIDVNTL